MKFTYLSLVAIAVFAFSSCSKKRTDLEVCSEGKWKYHDEQQNLDAFLEIDDDNNAKYYVPNSANLPGCTGNLLEATFQLSYIENSSEAVIKGLVKNNCYSSNFSFVDDNEKVMMTCTSNKLYITRADSTIYALTK